MSIWTTPTPAYQGTDQPAAQPMGFVAWLISLIQTPTPIYRYPPTTKAIKEAARPRPVTD